MRSSEPRRYAIVGLGGRHGIFREACTKTHSDCAELVALCDVNAGRLQLSRERARRENGQDVPGYTGRRNDAGHPAQGGDVMHLRPIPIDDR